MLLYGELGIAGFSGLAVLALLAAPNAMIMKGYLKISTELMSTRDKRIRLLTEMVEGVRVLKYCAWEAEVPYTALCSLIFTASCLPMQYSLLCILSKALPGSPSIDMLLYYTLPRSARLLNSIYLPLYRTRLFTTLSLHCLLMCGGGQAAEQIDALRRPEARLVARTQLLMAGLGFLFNLLPTLIAVASFGVYIAYTGNSLDPATAFTSIALFNILQVPTRLQCLSPSDSHPLCDTHPLILTLILTLIP